MYFVLEIECREIGKIVAMNGGIGFDSLDAAKEFIYEIKLEEPADYFDYFELKIIERTFDDNGETEIKEVQ